MAHYAYRRVSTKTQSKTGQGLETQLDKIKEWFKKNKIAWDEELDFKDDGVSGTKIDRDGLQELLATLRRGDRIIVLNTSRLWRNDTAKEFIKRELKKIGADIISIEQENYSIYTEEEDPDNFLTNAIREVLDQYDRINTNRKLKGGRRTKVKKDKMKACGNTPLGYKWKKDGENKPTVVVNEEEKVIVLLIFHKYMETKSIGKVKSFLDQFGYTTRNGKSFTDMSLREILRNDFYIGKVTWGRKRKKTEEKKALVSGEEAKAVEVIETEGKHEPIINKVLFGKVQAELARKRKGGRPTGVKEIFTEEELQKMKEREEFLAMERQLIEKVLERTEQRLRKKGYEEEEIIVELEEERRELEEELELKVKEKFVS